MERKHTNQYAENAILNKMEQGVRDVHIVQTQDKFVEHGVPENEAMQAAMKMDCFAYRKANAVEHVYVKVMQWTLTSCLYWIDRMGNVENIWEKDLQYYKTIVSVINIERSCAVYVYIFNLPRSEQQNKLCIFQLKNRSSLVEKNDPYALRFFSIYPYDYVLPDTWSLYGKSVRVLNVLEKMGICNFFGIDCKQSYDIAAIYFEKAGLPNMVKLCTNRGDPTNQMVTIVLKVLIDHITRPYLTNRRDISSLRLVCRAWNCAILKCGHYWTKCGAVAPVAHKEKSRVFFHSCAMRDRAIVEHFKFSKELQLTKKRRTMEKAQEEYAKLADEVEKETKKIKTLEEMEAKYFIP